MQPHKGICIMTFTAWAYKTIDFSSAFLFLIDFFHKQGFFAQEQNRQESFHKKLFQQQRRDWPLLFLLLFRLRVDVSFGLYAASIINETHWIKPGWTKLFSSKTAVVNTWHFEKVASATIVEIPNPGEQKTFQNAFLLPKGYLLWY